jgi:hypothetical protein
MRAYPGPHCSAKSSADPVKFHQNPIAFLKCVFASFKPREAEAIASLKRFFETGAGYFAVQMTRPQTIGYSLADSPVGLLAWIYEKLVSWTDSYPWTDDEGKNRFILYQLSFYLTFAG